jgi:hypothetical protein
MEKYLLKEMKKQKEINVNKKGVSLMISYVLLIVIAIVMSVIVFSYLKNVANVKPVIECKEGTSILIENYKCDIFANNTGRIELTIKNSGLFSIDGLISSFGIQDGREPTIKLVSFDRGINVRGEHEFENPLNPEKTIIITFSSNERKSDGSISPFHSNLKTVKIQPFIIDKVSNLVIPCGESIIKETLQ